MSTSRMNERSAETKLQARLDDAIAYIHDLGEHADICVYDWTKKLCIGCRCKRNPDKEML